jgi:serine/threonine protein kinase
MTLSPGQKLGPYEIVSPAGAGGMGEVYKARDTRLERIVAIKILPERSTQNEAMRARFEREAKAISSLNHPHICTLHDIGHENDIDYLVMEYLEGQTLSDRIKKGPIPITEALGIAFEIADALDKAHRQGLTHRDLKPSNIILTSRGAKLLDFGLAKFQFSDGPVAGISDITQTTPLTGSGTIVGTIQYMSPEQLEGAEADARSDIFAFGAILYEMISGRRPFEGKSQANLIAAIIERDPPVITDISPETPPGADRLIRKCLEKDPDKRWQSARDLADEIHWQSHSSSVTAAPASVADKKRFRFRLWWLIPIILLPIAGYYGFGRRSQTVQTRNLIRFEIEPNAGIQSISWPQISPDGTLLAFKAADKSNKERIWIRPLDAAEAYPLNGTEGALRPFWSPDSRYLAYSTAYKQLRKVPVSGGPPQLIGEFDRVADGCWGRDGSILFDGGMTDSIMMISASGGVVQAVTKLNHERGETYHGWPQFLPDGKHFLFLSSSDSANGAANHELKIGSTVSDEVLSLFPVTSRVKYCKPGYLLYVKDKILLARPFDADKLKVTGAPVSIAENISSPSQSVIPLFDVSEEGTLVYLTSDSKIKNQLVWVDRTGRQLSTFLGPARYSDVSLSPDDRQLVYSVDDPRTGTSDLWLYDFDREVSTRFTFDPGVDWGPVWSHDGSTIFFNRGILPNLVPYMKPSNASTPERRLVGPGFGMAAVTDVTKDMTHICLTISPNGQPDLAMMSLDHDSTITPILNSDRGELGGYFSPDGKYLAYVEQQPGGGGGQLFILELSGSRGKWQISPSGAPSYRWSPTGNELFYCNNNWDMISVPISSENGLKIGKSTVLFTRELSNLQLSGPLFDVTADGKKFILVSAIEQKEVLKINVVLNWTEMLKDRR